MHKEKKDIKIFTIPLKSVAIYYNIFSFSASFFPPYCKFYVLYIFFLFNSVTHSAYDTFIQFDVFNLITHTNGWMSEWTDEWMNKRMYGGRDCNSSMRVAGVEHLNKIFKSRFIEQIMGFVNYILNNLCSAFLWLNFCNLHFKRKYFLTLFAKFYEFS